MSADPRPNLGGLFNGSTPPERSSTISGAFEPRFLKQLPIDEQVRGAQAEIPPGPEKDADSPAERGDQRNHLSWVDPTRLVERYFALLQAVLDTNRELAVGLTNTVMSLARSGRAR